jgi:hypothetical protein
MEQPVGTLYPSYANTKAINEWTLDPMQYSITDFNFGSNNGGISNLVYKNEPNFNNLNNIYDLDKRSSKDISALSYSRFLSGNNGDFNPKETTDNNKGLWYYSGNNGNVRGADLSVQEPNHIILYESQRGGLNTSNLLKYSSNKSEYCTLFDYNQRYYPNNQEFSQYTFDPDYCKKIGISSNN